MIVREGNVFVIYSQANKKLGTAKTKREARLRLAQIEFYASQKNKLSERRVQ